MFNDYFNDYKLFYEVTHSIGLEKKPEPTITSKDFLKILKDARKLLKKNNFYKKMDIWFPDWLYNMADQNYWKEFYKLHSSDVKNIYIVEKAFTKNERWFKINKKSGKLERAK